MNALAGRDWTTWVQIDNVLALALNHATVAAIDSVDNDPDNTPYWNDVVHELAAEKARTAAYVKAKEEVPPDVSLNVVYRDINAALAPMVSDADVQDAINQLPVILPMYAEQAAAGGPTTNDIELYVGLAGVALLGIGVYLWKR